MYPLRLPMPNANPFPRLKAGWTGPSYAFYPALVSFDAKIPYLVTDCGTKDERKARATYAANAINEREGLLDLLDEVYARVRIDDNALFLRVSAAVASRAKP